MTIELLTKLDQNDPEIEGDLMLAANPEGTRVYTERQLARKIRLEAERTPKVSETAMPDVAINYLVTRQLNHLVQTARLTKFQAALLGMVVDGWRLIDISRKFGFSYGELQRRFHLLTRRLEKGGSPYDGLYEVYWQEVNRRGYRGK